MFGIFSGKCRVEGCNQPKGSGVFRSYCSIHECANFGCHDRKKKGYQGCENCLCGFKTSFNDQCNNLKSKNEYCLRHLCLACQKEPIVRNNDSYCTGCKCKDQSCLNIKSKKSKYCDRHTCNRCNTNYVFDCKENYCSYCMCSYKGCTELLSLNKVKFNQKGYCSLHGCQNCSNLKFLLIFPVHIFFFVCCLLMKHLFCLFDQTK